MKSIKTLIGGIALACTAMVAPAMHAQTLQFLTAGSSAQFGPFAIAAYALAEKGGVQAYHYTVKTSNCTAGAGVSPCYSSLVDNRKGGAPPEPGNLWLVWSTNGIWAYLSVDSTVGVRGFLSYPRASLSLAPLASLPLSATSNYLYWNDSSDDTLPTTAVFAAINNIALTAANTDIRPEDALYATNRAISLGYSKTNPVQSYFSSTITNPIAFSLSASVKDPVSGTTIPSSHAFQDFPVGAAPIVFLVNSTNLSAATNLSVTQAKGNNAAALFSGSGKCAGNLIDGIASTVSLSPILREPLSGTMNTTEFTNFNVQSGGSSQETGITTNPANQACGKGFRDRAIGTGEEVKAVQGNATLLHVATNPVGYAFFSYESTGLNAAYQYITLDGVDPINSSFSNGALPTCDTSKGYLDCPVTPGTSFPNLRNGTYRSWSEYRVISDSAGITGTKLLDDNQAAALITEIESTVNTQVPDFVPFKAACRTTATGKDEPGLDVYRQHFTPSGITLPTVPAPQAAGVPDDGVEANTLTCTLGGKHTLVGLTLGGTDSKKTNTELGGDVGGAIEGPFTETAPPTVPGPTGTKQ